MKSKWKVMHQAAGGEIFIRVYRIIDIGQAMHGGNLEFYPDMFDSDEKAWAVADSMNREGDK